MRCAGRGALTTCKAHWRVTRGRTQSGELHGRHTKAVAMLGHGPSKRAVPVVARASHIPTAGCQRTCSVIVRETLLVEHFLASPLGQLGMQLGPAWTGRRSKRSAVRRPIMHSCDLGSKKAHGRRAHIISRCDRERRERHHEKRTRQIDGGGHGGARGSVSDPESMFFKRLLDPSKSPQPLATFFHNGTRILP